MTWIDRQDTLDHALQRVGAHAQIAVDTEADSLHSYFDKVCLIQISLPDEDLIVPGSRLVDLSQLEDIGRSIACEDDRFHASRPRDSGVASRSTGRSAPAQRA